MPTEIEIKMKVSSLGPTRDRLATAGAKRIGLLRELNTFFDRPDRSLLAGHQGLRVRVDTREDGTQRTRITFKGPPRAGEMSNREEIEIATEPGERAEPLLQALGFVRVQSFEKRRETWELGGCEIELDELPVLGTFVEIEGPRESDVQAVRRSLGLENEPRVKPTYATMVAEHLAKHPELQQILRF